MTGWITLAFGAAAAFALLWSLRVARPLWPMVGAALMLGATGYALQGRPALPGADPEPPGREQATDPALIEIRQQMFGRFTYAESYFYIADALGRSGNHLGAARAVMGGVRSTPDNLPLWTWLGMTLSRHDGDAVSPAAAFAFRRAQALNPRHPAPWFFEGMAHARAGDYDRTRAYWRRSLAVSRPGAAYRTAIAERIAALDRFLAMRDRMRQEMGGAPLR